MFLTIDLNKYLPSDEAVRFKARELIKHYHDQGIWDGLIAQGWTPPRAEIQKLAEKMQHEEWLDPTSYDLANGLVQVLCEVTQPTTSDFPRACEMPISSGDKGVGELFVSIGFRDDPGNWLVAGWDMMQDCWTDARCYLVKGWQPMASTGGSE
ncbi:hypothetical protein LC092_05265 [Stappia stellulata]|uniref:hypothetical protein n=1 Tax=Stappia stellulata TaxID=71235 RepID=UPI001CD4E7C9|nr:hypothetical protein [Stappia stellulata]MCA1241836.1 hypothetical protein [Stappia stellulata]